MLIRYVRGGIIAPMPGVGRETAKYGGKVAPPPLDREIAELAARQHGVLALRQLMAVGLSARAVHSRVAAGKLHRIHRGAYAVGHSVLSVRGHWMAAVLACGLDAVLSYRSAAALSGIRQTARAGVDVTVPGRGGRSLPGIDVHRARILRPADLTTIDGIPCTTVARTLLDLAEVTNRRAVERAIDQAEVLRILDARAVQDVLDHANGRRGAPVLRQIIKSFDLGQTITKSELEERLLALCAAAGFPRPLVNVWIPLDDGHGDGGLEVDFLWPDRRLIVEADSRRHHDSRREFAQDRRRDQRLLVAGFRVVRFTWRDIVDEPEWVVATIRTLLTYG